MSEHLNGHAPTDSERIGALEAQIKQLTEMLQPKRWGGNPARIYMDGERVGLSLRVTPATKRRLDKKAEETGRSISQEAEMRLDQSFLIDDMIAARLVQPVENEITATNAGVTVPSERQTDRIP